MPWKYFSHLVNVGKDSTVMKLMENISSEGILQPLASWPYFYAFESHSSGALSYILVLIYASYLLYLSCIFCHILRIFSLNIFLRWTHCFSLLCCFLYNLNIFPKLFFITYIHSFPGLIINSDIRKKKSKEYICIGMCLGYLIFLFFFVYMLFIPGFINRRYEKDVKHLKVYERVKD